VTSTTIVAAASGPGPSGVAIVRVSGPLACDVLTKLTGGPIAPRLATLRTLCDQDSEAIDKALVLWFPAPNSFTGEDVCEFHVHGGRAVVAGTIEACLAIDGVKLAKPGEFTRRTFENGKMDLSAAEGLGDLIEAETTAQRRQALRQMEGALGQEVMAWREQIIDALADAEGDIDFPDEDLPPGLSSRARTRILSLCEILAENLAASDRAVRVRDGFRVTILGPPNAGKSSLINVLAKREAAIVSPIAGTTRDVVEVRLVLSGAVVWIADTAGLRDGADEIESIGIERAYAQGRSADLRLGLITNDEDRAALAPFMTDNDIWLLAKADEIDWLGAKPCDLIISSKSGVGIDALEALIAARASNDLVGSESAPLTRLRHKEAVSDTIASLTRALEADGGSPELIAEDLRLAARALGQIIGRVDMEDVLDRLFSQFCIGK
jgi:tRNA modification GTPase